MKKLDPKRMRKGYALALCLATLVGATAQADRFVVTTLSAPNADLGCISTLARDGINSTLYVGDTGGGYWGIGYGLVRYEVPDLVPDEELVSATFRIKTYNVISATYPPTILVRHAGNDSWLYTIKWDDTTFGTGNIDLQLGTTLRNYSSAIDYDGSSLTPIGSIYGTHGSDDERDDIWYEYNVLDFLGIAGEGPGETISFFIDYSTSGARSAQFWGDAGGQSQYPQLVITTFIPEPTAFALLGLGTFPLMMRRRRR